jgi:hypothetical protein
VFLLATAASACAESESALATPPPVASIVPALAAPSPAPLARASDVTFVCRNLCEHVRPLGCAGQSQCPETCVGMAAGTPCTGEIVALYECLLREPISRWECSDDGTAAIRDGSCESEQALAAACLDTKVKP